MSLISQWKLNDNASNTTISDSIGSNNGTFNDISLKGHWKMNDNAANSDVIDSSGNVNTGTYTDSGGAINTDTGSVAGKINTALDFDGVDEYVSVGEVIDAKGSQSMSISLWVKTTLSGSINYFLGTDVNDGWYIRTVPSNEVIFKIDDGSNDAYDIGTTAVNDGNWHHIVMVLDSDNNLLKGYVDNSEEISIDSSSVGEMANDSNFAIGKVGSYYFDGSLDDVRIYDKALSSDEISNLYNSDNGTEADDADTILHSVTGKVNKALTFDGADEYVEIPKDVSLDVAANGAFTISAWFKLDTLPSNAGDNMEIFRADDDGATGLDGTRSLYFLRINSTDNIQLAAYEDGMANHLIISDPSTVSTGIWYHAVGTVNLGGNAYLYVNGSQVASGDASLVTAQIDPATSRYIGAWYSNLQQALEEKIDGQLDDIRIYNHALTQTQVLALYNNSNGTEIATPSLSNMLGINF